MNMHSPSLTGGLRDDNDNGKDRRRASERIWHPLQRQLRRITPISAFPVARCRGACSDMVLGVFHDVEMGAMVHRLNACRCCSGPAAAILFGGGHPMEQQDLHAVFPVRRRWATFFDRWQLRHFGRGGPSESAAAVRHRSSGAHPAVTWPSLPLPGSDTLTPLPPPPPRAGIVGEHRLRRCSNSSACAVWHRHGVRIHRWVRREQSCQGRQWLEGLGRGQCTRGSCDHLLRCPRISHVFLLPQL